MSACVKSSPAFPALPKPESRRTRRVSSSTATSVDNNHVLPEVKKSPVTDRSQVEELKLQDDFIPSEVLHTLTATMPPNLTKPSKHKGCGMRPPDAVWHHSVGRKKYQYFLDQPTSVTGAGRDISFLCDALASQRKRLPLPPMTDKMIAQDVQKELSSLETLIPEEYHIVKNKGLKGLQCYDDKFTVLLMDEEKGLKLFPSMKPSGRLEAVQLMRVMDDMLEKAGANQEFEELTCISQMQGLLELVRKEQNIYNIVFHELIRQVSVECAERGQLLAKLRQRYAALLDRIPRQLKSLHMETLAQRALDRRLMEEIICFKDSITQLNKELSKMRERDEQLSTQAEKTQEELDKVLEQSQRNADIVGEYHHLYEMQRRRLEQQVTTLTEERDLWSKVTYSIALKIIKMKNLQLVSRLHVSEQMWSKISQHFTAVLTVKDSEDLNQVMQLTEQWKEQLTGFMENVREKERKQCEDIKAVQRSIVKWHRFCEAIIRSPDMNIEKASEKELFSDLTEWTTTLTLQCERYGGEELLSGQETLDTLTQLQETWVEVCLQLFRRHPAPDGAAPRGQAAMKEISDAVTELHKQLGTRINGESGIHKNLMSLTGAMELWVSTLKSFIARPEVLPHSHWLKLEKALDSWEKLCEDALINVDSTQPHSEKIKQISHTQIKVSDVFTVLQEFLSSQNNFFDFENLTLCEKVSSMHTLLTRWMVELLLQMVPDQTDDQEPSSLSAPAFGIIEDVSPQKLEEDARSLAQKLEYLSKYITGSCQAIVEEEVQKNISQDETENELQQLNRLQRECEEWVEVCRILLSDVTRHPVELKPSGKALPQSVVNTRGSLEDIHSETEPEEEEEEEEKEKEEEEEEEEKQAVPVASSEQHSSEKPGRDELEEVKEGSDEREGEKKDPVLRLIGHDGHITEQSLGEESGTDELVLLPRTEDTQQAFNALTTVTVLQEELLAAEARAVSAEDRALKVEESLHAALEKIQELERQLSRRHSPESKVHKKPVELLPKAGITPEPKEASQKPAPSPKPTKGSKKH